MQNALFTWKIADRGIAGSTRQYFQGGCRLCLAHQSQFYSTFSCRIAAIPPLCLLLCPCKMAFEQAKEFLKGQHLAPLLSAVSQNLVTLNKWSTVGQALQVRCSQGESVGWGSQEASSLSDRLIGNHLRLVL